MDDCDPSPRSGWSFLAQSQSTVPIPTRGTHSGEALSLGGPRALAANRILTSRYEAAPDALENVLRSISSI
jgi:hypothetical protein